VPISDIFDFQERRFQSLYHRVKIFIFGQDVSNWLRGSVSVTYGNRDSYNTANFELSNPHKIWQLTKQNLQGKFRQASGGEYDETAKMKIFTAKNDKYLNPFVSLEIKEQIFSQTVTRPASVDSNGTIEFDEPGEFQERRYRLAVNDCVFNKHDPIRIFAHNPYNSTSDEWVEVFCGFIQGHPISTNYLNGESFVRLECYCIRQMMTKLRVKLNGFIDPRDPIKYLDAGFFADFSTATNNGHPFSGVSLEETIKQLITGSINPSIDTTHQVHYKSAGVGDFKLGNVVCFDPTASEADKAKTLERWHLMTLFGVNKLPYPDENLDKNQALWLKTEEVNRLGKATLWHVKNADRGPDARYLHFLLPKGGTGPGTLVSTTIDQHPQAVEWASRWEVIRDFASKLDFQVLTSPSGDVLVEFPMYGFTPSAFGKMEKVLTFEIHQKEETLNDEAEDFPTLLQVTGELSSNSEVNDKAPKGTQDAPRSFVYSPVLASRYGVIVETHNVPFSGQDTSQIGQALLDRLAKLGLIEFTKRQADASVMDGSVVYRLPALFPNRPIWFKRSSRIANLTSVTINWQVGKHAEMHFGTNMLMAERFHKDGTTTDYRLLTGAKNTPIDYRDIWTETAGHPKSGTPSNSSNGVEPSTKTVSATGNPDAPDGGQKEKIISPPSIQDTDKLYQPFLALVNELLDAAAKQGMELKVTETFRTPEKQQADFEKGVSHAEPYQSLHQFGLAVDIVPVTVSDNKRQLDFNDTAKFSELNKINKTISQPLVWGGTFRSFYDGAHFEAPWISGKEAQQIFFKHRSDPEYYRFVWAEVDRRTSYNAASKSDGTVGPPVPAAKRAGTGANINVPPAATCEPSQQILAGFDDNDSN
jgi:hypothetical protein